MFCTICGAEMPDNSKFCPKCGKATDLTKGNASVAAVRHTNTVRSRLKGFISIDRILGAAAFVLMIVVMFVPLSISDSLDYEKPETLFTIYGGSATVINAIIVIAYVLIALLFVVFKFIWKNKIPSTIGCILSWILLLFTVPLTFIEVIHPAMMPGLQQTITKYYAGVGLYLWAAACILQIISLVLDQRKLGSRR